MNEGQGDGNQRSDAPARLAELAERYWQERLEAEPLGATALGYREYDHLLRDASPAGLEAERRRVRAVLDEASALPADALSSDDRFTLAALQADARTALDLMDSGLETWEIDPMFGPQVYFSTVESFQPVSTPNQARAMVERWRAMGPYLDTHVSNMRNELGAGRVAVREPVERVVAQLESLLDQDDSEWALLNPIKVEHADWEESDRVAFHEGLRAAVRDIIRPAMARYLDLLRDEILPAARPPERAGLVHLEGGLDTYRRMIRVYTSLDLPPEELHATGLREVERINAEIVELGGRVTGKGDLREIFDALLGEPSLYFDTPDEVLSKAQEAVGRAKAAMGEWFGRLPQADCEVLAVPDYQAEDGPLGYYRTPAEDGSRPGQYFVNTVDPETRARYSAEALAYHEAIPGHHLQLAIAQELSHLPTFRRYADQTAYIEGWGLYSERLADEMGLYSSDLDRIGILTFDAWRACRLVVDTGMHALGWSRQQAIVYMRDNAPVPENNILNEIDRYISWPGQALAYKTGQLEILRLRAQAESALGDRFDIRAFHDAVLGNGPLALTALREVVDSYIGSARA